MAVRIPPALIIALVETGLIVLVILWFFAPAIFGGPEITAAKNIAEQLETACAEDIAMSTMFSEYLPDSKGANPPYYLSIAVDKNNLMLVARRGVKDIGGMFADFVSCTCSKIQQMPLSTRVSSQIFKRVAKLLDCSCAEGTRILKTILLKTCWDRDIHICVVDDSGRKCDNFQLESHEGHESLAFTIARLPSTNEVELGYSRSTICGDGRCCEGETKDNCNVDCPGECGTAVLETEE